MLFYLTILTLVWCCTWQGHQVRTMPQQGCHPVCVHQTNRIPYMSWPNSQHIAEKYFQAPPFTLSTCTILKRGWSVRTRIYTYLILYEALEDERAQVCYNSITHAIIPPKSMLYHQSRSTINQLKYHLQLGNIAPMCCLEAHGCNTLHITLQ